MQYKAGGKLLRDMEAIMGITVEWDNPQKTIIRFVYKGRWTWDDMAGAMEQANRLMDTVTYRVDHIVDVRESTLLPPSVVSQAKRVLNEPHANLGLTLVVGASHYLKLMLDIVSRVYPAMMSRRKMKLVSTMEDAYAAIAAQREQHPQEK